MSKVKINSLIYGMDEKPIPLKDQPERLSVKDMLAKQENPPEIKQKFLTLRQVCIVALLTPVQDERNAQGLILQKGDDALEKDKKYDLYQKIKKTNVEDPAAVVDLKSEEVTKLKELIAKFEAQLVYGQCRDLLENKKE